MKNAATFPMKSRLIFGVSLVLLIAGVYFVAIQKSTEEEGLNSSNLKTAALSEDAPVGFVNQGDESSPSGTDLVVTYEAPFEETKALAHKQLPSSPFQHLKY
jgi:hypothetical protein